MVCVMSGNVGWNQTQRNMATAFLEIGTANTTDANRTRHKINSQPNPRHIAVTRCLVGFTEFKFSSFGGVRRGTPGGGQSVHCYSVFSNHPGLRPPPPMDWNLVHKTGAVATITNHYPLTRTLLNLPLAFYQICYIICVL